MVERKDDMKGAGNTPSKESTKTTLTIFTIIYVVSLATWLLTAAFAVIALGGPKPAFKNQLMEFFAWSFFVCFLLYPVFTIPFMIISWVCYKKNNFRWASKFMFIPLGYIALGFILAFISMFATN